MNGWRRAAYAVISCASLACGGKLLDDGSTQGDAAASDATGDVGLGWSETGPPTVDVAPPPSSTCNYAASEIVSDSNGKCQATETWTCGADVYMVQCNCWSQTCECYGNGDEMLAFGFQGCPSCTLGSRRDREVSVPALILAPLLGSLITLTAAWCTTGSRARRVLGVVIGVCALLAPWLLPPRPALLRAICALVWFINVMRVVDLAQMDRPWSFGRRVLHVSSVVDSRRLVRRAPRFELVALLALVGWTSLFAASLFVVIAHTPETGALHWLVRWSAGVVAIYAAVAWLYRLLFVVYSALGFDVPPLHLTPARSRSVQELWGERWARPISDWPGATLFRPWARRRRPLVGVVLAFVVSAAFHAYAIWVGLGFVTGLAMTALIFGYFVAQAAVMSIEQTFRVRRWPALAGHVWTIAWMLALSPMFVEPALRLLQ